MSTPRSTEKTAVAAPTPNTRIAIAAQAKDGWRRKPRTAYLTSRASAGNASARESNVIIL
jgi:hypothetical protein